jgi:peptidoglycan/xylan/chitin deacetylase (PgdA/CDA1 family)
MILSRRALALGLTAAALPGVGSARVRSLRGHARRGPWPGGARAAVSLTYDDGLDSQLANVAPELEARDLKATFYLTKENMEARLDDWRKLARRGHEMGDHSVSHPCEVAAYTPERFYAEEIAPMERFLDTEFGPRRRTFAYPCGQTELGRGPGLAARDRAYRRLLGRTFAGARLVDTPPNDPGTVLRDRLALRAFEPTYDRDDPEPARAYLNHTEAMGGWAILVFHEVLDRKRGDGDTSIAVHRAILDDLQARNLWCAPVRTVLARLDGGTRRG